MTSRYALRLLALQQAAESCRDRREAQRLLAEAAVMKQE